jgi:hypothetical protein
MCQAAKAALFDLRVSPRGILKGMSSRDVNSPHCWSNWDAWLEKEREQMRLILREVRGVPVVTQKK